MLRNSLLILFAVMFIASASVMTCERRELLKIDADLQKEDSPKFGQPGQVRTVHAIENIPILGFMIVGGGGLIFMLFLGYVKRN